MATILIVDDHPTNREYLATLLGYHKHRLIQASDGAQALALARQERPDAVITDILMPTMDGYEFVRQLRADPALADVAVIFYTAHYRSPEARKLALDCGVRYTLTKPCDPEEIIDTLNHALGRVSAPKVAPSEAFDRAHLELVTNKLADEAEQLRRTSARLQALIDVNLHLASERNPTRLLEHVCHAARDFLGAKYALLVVGEKDATATKFWVTSGVPAASAASIAAPQLDGRVVGESWRTRKPCRMVGLAGDPEVVGLPAGYPPAHSLLVAPIVSLSHAYGWIALSEKLGEDAFSEEEERLLGILCAQLGRTYENGSLLRELRESEERYRTIFENSVMGVFAAGASGEFVSTNPALLRMLGASGDSDDAIAHDVYVDAGDRLRFRELLVTQKVVTGFETRWQRRDGSAIWVSLSARLVDHRNDGQISHIGMVEDITERVRLRDAVKEREAGLRHAERMAKLAHVITGPDGSFETWSETLPRIAGLAPEALPRSTRAWLALVHPDDRGAFRAASLLAASEHRRSDLEYRLQRLDGEVIHLRQAMEPLSERDTSGRSRWFNTMQDVSEEIRTQDRIKRLNRVYAVLSAINSAIVRVHDRQALFDEACRIAVVEGAFKMVWIGEVDAVSGEGRVVASHGTDQGYVDRIRFGSRPDYVNPASRVVRERAPIVCNDIATGELLLTRRSELLARGHHALAVFPLVVGGRVEAVLSLHAGETGFFDEEEIRLLTELAGDVAFALEYIAKSHKLDYLAYYDNVTALPNSTLFRDRLAQLLSHAEEDGSAATLYLIDLDNFTHVNDTLGRRAGDVLLSQVAERFAAKLPKSSSLARISADTFAVVVGELGNALDASIDLLKEQLFASLQSRFMVEGHELRVSAQAGIAMYPGDGEDADTLFKHAEAALKHAKAVGEEYIYYAPAMNARMSERLALESQLRDALEEGQFELHYQPKVDLSSGRIVSSEALIRWRHPERGLLLPGAFIGVAEDSDIIIPIEDWVLRTACMQTRQWHAMGLAKISVSVNLSTRQFRDDALRDRVANALSASGLEAQCLELELTENIVMHDAGRFVEKLRALKELGLRLSLDDFGTGYSSLSYLKRFPLDLLKVDQSFIRDVTTSSDDAAIVRAVISVGHSLGLDVVAEGVETQAQVEWLRRERCEQIQGYFFSRPVPAAEFEQMLRSRKTLAPPHAGPAAVAQTLLIVDDEEFILASLVRLLRKDGYRILTALNADEALNLLALNVVHVIISDHRMPVMTGAEFFFKVKTLYPDTVRILFSGYIEMEALTDAVNRGAVYRFLLKPWDDQVLRENIREAFHYYWLNHSELSDRPVPVGSTKGGDDAKA